MILRWESFQTPYMADGEEIVLTASLRYNFHIIKFSHFAIAKRWKRLTCPSMDGWMNKMYVCTMEYLFSFKKEGNSHTCSNTDEP